MNIAYLRSYKLFSFAIFDFLMSYIFMYIIGISFHLNIKKLFLSVIPLSLIIHKIIGLETPLIKSVFNPKNTKDYMIMLIVFINELFLYYK